MTRARAVVLLTVLSWAVLSACGALATEDSLQESIDDARAAGLTPYWLGESFIAGGKHVRLGRNANFDGPEQPHVSLYYWLEDGEGRATIGTYSETQSDWERYFNLARRNPKTSIENVKLGDWEGELWLVPTASRRVNAVTYMLRIDGMVVIATAKASSTGEPATDLNPLIDAELWAEVLEEHLQPYPSRRSNFEPRTSSP